jgi:hypothetical protein
MRKYVTGLGLITMAGAAVAQVPKPAPPLAPQPVHSEHIEVQGYRQLFIAPSGEPFRAVAGAPYPVAAWFAQADANHDGRIDLGEFNADFMRFFDRLDTNHDGMLSSAEIKAYETDIAPEVAADYGASYVSAPDRVRGGGSGGHGGGGGGRYGLIAIAEPVAAMDTSFSGHVSRGEAQAAAQRRFNLLDPDDKGSIGWNDLPQTMAERARRRR